LSIKSFSNSPSKLEGVDALTDRGVCQNTNTQPNTAHSTAAGGTSPNLGEEFSNSPSKLEGVPERQGRVSETGMCQKERAKNTSAIKNFRRKLRNNSTPAEAALWNILKEKKIAGLQFRRQFSIGNFILDFYCPKLRLAIELDGNYHDFVDIKDLERDKYLAENFGIQTIRFENKTVFQQPETIVNSILNVLEETHSTAVNGTSPNLGEEFLNSPSKLEGVPERQGRVSESGVCEKTNTLHSQQADSSPNLGEQL